MKIGYRGFNKSGREVTDTIDARSPAEAAESLRRRGLYVAEMTQAGESLSSAGKRVRWLGRGRRLKDLSMFTRQLYVLVSSGTQLVQALGALERQVKEGSWRDAIAHTRRQVEEGATLAEAMAAYPEYFDPIYLSLVTAGESAGNLPIMLERLGKLTQKRLQIRNSILGAMIYPVLLLVLASAVLTVMLLFVVPRFAGLFEELEVPLPASTKTLIGLSHALESYWWALLIIIGGGVAALRAYLKSPAGKEAHDTALLRLPGVNRIVRNFATARITRLLGVLLEGHVPVLEALRLTRNGAGNVHYAGLITQAEEAVTQGDPISSAFLESDLIAPSISEAVKSGEQSGRVGPLLLDISDFLDEENEIITRSLMSIIEPVILIFLGALVAFVALSLFMPLFDLTSMTRGGAA